MALQILIVGQTDRAEAMPLRDWMLRAWQSADIRRHATLQQALVDLGVGPWIPDLIVVVQSWPDEQTQQEIDQLSRCAPLARLVVCYGSWCESDGRTRNLWPLAVRVPMRSAASRLAGEWRLLCGDQVSSFPMSASREERFAVDHPGLRSGAAAVSVVVISSDPEYRRYLTELLVGAGHKVLSDDHWMHDLQPCVVVFDVDPWNDQQRTELSDRSSHDVILAMMSRPNPEITAELIELGVVDVVPKLGDQQNILNAVECTAVRVST